MFPVYYFEKRQNEMNEPANTKKETKEEKKMANMEAKGAAQAMMAIVKENATAKENYL